MNELREINCETLAELSSFDKTMILRERNEWLKRQRREDKNNYIRQERKLYLFKFRKDRLLLLRHISIEKKHRVRYIHKTCGKDTREFIRGRNCHLPPKVLNTCCVL